MLFDSDGNFKTLKDEYGNEVYDSDGNPIHFIDTPCNLSTMISTLTQEPLLDMTELDRKIMVDGLAKITGELFSNGMDFNSIESDSYNTITIILLLKMVAVYCPVYFKNHNVLDEIFNSEALNGITLSDIISETTSTEINDTLSELLNNYKLIDELLEFISETPALGAVKIADIVNKYNIEYKNTNSIKKNFFSYADILISMDNKRKQQDGGKLTFSPQDYLDFLSKFSDLLNDRNFYESLSDEEASKLNEIIDIMNKDRGSDKKFDILLDRMSYIMDLTNLAETVVVNYDPLVIDLGKNGFELTSVDDGVHFDMDSNGIAEKTGWVKGDDAFLVLDRNGNGIIDNSGEMFGDRTVLQNGEYASSGFEALAEYDSNMDGFINEDDEVFSKLMLWLDINQDGISTPDELFALSDFEISAINLNYTGIDLLDDDSESLLANLSTVVFNDGTETSVGEFKFRSDKIDAAENINFNISEDIKNLPDVRAIGYVHSLHYAMAIDETGTLKSLVERFVNSSDISEREALVKDILFFICDAANIDPSSRGGLFDARKLAVLEKFFAEPFEGANGSNPNSQAAPILEESFNELLSSYYLDMVGSSLKKYYTAAYTTVAKNEDGSPKLNIPLFNAIIKSDLSKGILDKNQLVDLGRYLITQDNAAFTSFKNYFTALDRSYGDLIEEYCNTIKGTYGNDSLNASDSGSVISGLEGNDVLYGSSSSDLLFGGNDDDVLYGRGGDDILEGGIGNDYLEGNEGNDTYVFNLGDGVDTIYDYENSQTEGKSDRIVFGEGISADDIVFERNGNSLTIKYSENDRVTVNDAYRYDDGRCFVENIEFADGTKWDVDEIKLRASIRIGTDTNDVLHGYGANVVYDNNETFYAGAGNDIVYSNDGNDTVYGESGNDKLYGGRGDDTLNGGVGNDYLEGNEGNDTYVFNLGDGVDTIYDYENSQTEGKSDRIVFGEGISADDIVFERNGNSLTIKYSENDRVTVNDAYRYDDGRCFVENIEFADGTKWDLDEIKLRASIRIGTDTDDVLHGYGANVVYDNNETFYAGAGNDTVYANDGNDTVYGESGNDKLYGRRGDDTLNGGVGNDYLEGNEGNDTYVFNLGDGVDTIYDYENSQTEGKSDRIVFGEGISADDIVFERNGNSLTIKYSENDRVTVNDAYRYDDGRCFVENIEFADGKAGVVDYSNLVLEIVDTESLRKFNDVDIVEHALDNDDKFLEESTQNLPVDSIVDQCVSSIGNSMLYVENTINNEFGYDTSSAPIPMVDNMVNLIVQDMSEFSAETVSEVETVTNFDTPKSNVQLWMD